MIGSAIFTSTGFMAGDLGSASIILLAWAAGAMFAFFGALCYSELAINNPQSGGEYVYLTKAYGPSWGFMSGWVSFFAGFSAPIAAAAIAFSNYLAHFFPALDSSKTAFTVGSGDWTIHVGSGQIAACLLIALFTLLNMLRIETVARVQNTLTAIKIVVVASFIVLGGLPLMAPFEAKSDPAGITIWQTDGDVMAFPGPRWQLLGFNLVPETGG